jgi:predicted nuclease with RNAse H fold
MSLSPFTGHHSPFLTAGIDLAAQPEHTGGALVVWHGATAELTELRTGLDDHAIIALVRRADRTGIDAPFGWPDAFVDAVAAHHQHRPWPAASRDDPGAFRRRLRLRLTDEAVTADLGLRPLSVSSDLIAIPAMRCAQLLQRLAAEDVEIDRSGISGRVGEAYPAAALHVWGLPRSGYKGTKGREVRANIVEALLSRLPALHVAPEQRALMLASDHALDALLAALIARATALGQTRPPPPHALDAARREGWIHYPPPGHQPADLFVA